MSIRKYFPPDFPEFIELLKTHGIAYIERYRKAEALVGDSNSIALIDLYFDKKFSRHLITCAPKETQAVLLDVLLEERKYVSFEEAFSRAYQEFLRKHPDL